MAEEEEFSLSLSSFSAADLLSKPAVKDSPLHPLFLEDGARKLEYCSAPIDRPVDKPMDKPADKPMDKPADKPETREQAMDRKVKDHFGADVFNHLKDWDWLIENRKKLEDGFKKANNQEAWDMAWRMRELSMLDGKPLIYLSKQDGPTRGNLIPKRYDIYLRRGSLRSDDYIGQLTH